MVHVRAECASHVVDTEVVEIFAAGKNDREFLFACVFLDASAHDANFTAIDDCRKPAVALFDSLEVDSRADIVRFLFPHVRIAKGKSRDDQQRNADYDRDVSAGGVWLPMIVLVDRHGGECHERGAENQSDDPVRLL